MLIELCISLLLVCNHVTASMLLQRPHPHDDRVIRLQNGFKPEGICMGAGHDLFIGSLLGYIQHYDLRTNKSTRVLGSEIQQVTAPKLHFPCTNTTLPAERVRTTASQSRFA